MKNNLKKNILVVAAHPDDEVLGVGGTLCRHRDTGDKIAILILANGEDSRGSKIADADKRFAQAKKVATFLKAELYLENFPDNAFNVVSLLEITKKVEKVLFKVKPDIIYTHHNGDLNIDHRITSEAVLTAARPILSKKIHAILAFETPSSTEWQVKDYRQFAPNYYVDISKYMALKKKLLMIYKDELRKYPHSRSLEGIEILAKYRGMESGIKAAEAFQVLRIIT